MEPKGTQNLLFVVIAIATVVVVLSRLLDFYSFSPVHLSCCCCCSFHCCCCFFFCLLSETETAFGFGFGASRVCEKGVKKVINH